MLFAGVIKAEPDSAGDGACPGPGMVAATAAAALRVKIKREQNSEAAVDGNDERILAERMAKEKEEQEEAAAELARVAVEQHAVQLATAQEAARVAAEAGVARVAAEREAAAAQEARQQDILVLNGLGLQV